MDNADLVVGEEGVAAGEFDFGHVTADAVRLGYRAGLGGGGGDGEVGWCIQRAETSTYAGKGR